MTERTKKLFFSLLAALVVTHSTIVEPFAGQQLITRFVVASVKSFIKNHPYITASIVIYIFRRDIIRWIKEHVPDAVGQHPAEATVLIGMICLGTEYHFHREEYAALFMGG